MIEILENKTPVLLPFDEEGIIIKRVERIWASYYVVKITKGRLFHKKGEVVDF